MSSWPFPQNFLLEDKLKYANFLESNLNAENYGEYFSLLEECSNMGSEEAILKLSEIYLYGDEFTEEDNTAGIETLKVAFSNFKIPNLAYKIGKQFWYKFEDDSEIEAAKWLKIAADLGHGEACADFAELAKYGWGCEKNLEDAIRYFNLSITYGNHSAYSKLAELYLNEFDDLVDQTRAIKPLQEGSLKGNSKCQYIYSTLLYEGKLINKDEKESLMWLTKSAESGFSKAEYFLGIEFLNGSRLEKNIFKAFEWFETAANNHYPKAQIMVYSSYLNGSGVEINKTLAFAWLLIAIRNSDETKDLRTLLHYLSHSLANTLNKNQIERAQKFRDEFTKNYSFQYKVLE